VYCAGVIFGNFGCTPGSVKVSVTKKHCTAMPGGKYKLRKERHCNNFFINEFLWFGLYIYRVNYVLV
jgi:hypothetical protein